MKKLPEYQEAFLYWYKFAGMGNADQKGIKSWSEDERPREKLYEKGPGSLSNAELLAILLGSGTRDISAVQVGQHILSSVDRNYAPTLRAWGRPRPLLLQQPWSWGAEENRLICQRSQKLPPAGM